MSVVSSFSNPSTPAVFRHAESPVWDSVNNALYFVDVHKQNVHRFDYSSGEIFTKHINYGQVNVVSLVAGSQRLLVAVRSALYLMDWGIAGDAALRLLITVDHGLPDNVINDGKADAIGRFWAGTKGPHTGGAVMPFIGQFFSIEQDNLNPRLHLRPVTISNGLAWSPNNSVLYYVDSATRCVEAFDFDLQKGKIGGRRTLINLADYDFEDAIPDGITIDNQGHLWVALMFGGAVLHIDPDNRQVVYRYKLPVSGVTSVAWGGPKLDELFVTTGRISGKERTEPLGGALFILQNTGSVGLPSAEFRFHDADTY